MNDLDQTVYNTYNICNIYKVGRIHSVTRIRYLGVSIGRMGLVFHENQRRNPPIWFENLRTALSKYIV